jgi:hypothetical protein
VARPWWVKFAGAVGSSTVVVPNVVREHHTQVPLTEDQHAVGEFGSDSAGEPFGETVRPRAMRRNPDHVDAHIGQDSVERRGELTGPVSDEDPQLGEVIAEIYHQVRGSAGWSTGGPGSESCPAALLRSRLAGSGTLSRCVVVLLVCPRRGLVSPGFASLRM